MLKTKISTLGFALLITVCPLFTLPSGHAGDLFEEVSTDKTVYVRGLISSVDDEKMQISVRPLKGKRVVISIGPDTLLEGVSRLDELEKKQQVKVWYSVEDDGNKALKIKKMMDLGC